jgi:hypothetical protein
MPRGERVPPLALVLSGLGALLLVAAIVMAFVWPAALAGWLGAIVECTGVPAGALYLLMMMRLIPGSWGRQLRLTMESATLLTPYAGVLFIPVLIGLGAIYPWMHHYRLTDFQEGLLSPFAYVLITILRYAALFWFGWRMRRRRAPAATAAIGLIVLTLLATVVAFIWLLSIEPDYASSGFGLNFMEREFTTAFCAALLLRLSIGRPPARPVVLSGLLFTLLLLWLYFEYFSFVVTWSGNLRSHDQWWLRRGGGGWDGVTWAWAVASGIPLLALFYGRVRKSLLALKIMAAAVLLGKVLEMAWITLPGFGLAAIIAYVLAIAGFTLLLIAGLPLALKNRVHARAPKGERS